MTSPSMSVNWTCCALVRFWLGMTIIPCARTASRISWAPSLVNSVRFPMGTRAPRRSAPPHRRQASQPRRCISYCFLGGVAPYHGASKSSWSLLEMTKDPMDANKLSQRRKEEVIRVKAMLTGFQTSCVYFMSGEQWNQWPSCSCTSLNDGQGFCGLWTVKQRDEDLRTLTLTARAFPSDRKLHLFFWGV